MRDNALDFQQRPCVRKSVVFHIHEEPEVA